MTTTTDEPRLRLLSLGAGVQSTAIMLLVRLGELPPLDGAIFADTGWEPQRVYEHLDRLEREIAEPAGVTIYRVSTGNIRDDALNPDKRFASMPFHVGNVPCSRCSATGEVDEPAHADQETGEHVVAYAGRCPQCRGTGRTQGIARRQCTSEYKLRPIKQQTRALLGYPHPTPVPRGVFAEQWIGISRDEWHRAKSSDVGYARNAFPLLDLDMTRKDCQRLLAAHGFGETPKSACIGCPFHGNRRWRELRDEHPDEWRGAVEFDHAVRRGSARATAQGMELLGNYYLHRSAVPLDEAPIDHVTRREWHDRQTDLFEHAKDLTAEEDELAGCSPFACRADESDLPFVELDELSGDMP